MLQGLISKLSSHGWLNFVAARGAAAAGEDMDAVVCFEQLVGELHLAAMQVAVVTSGVNALSEGVRLEESAGAAGPGPAIAERGQNRPAPALPRGTRHRRQEPRGRA